MLFCSGSDSKPVFLCSQRVKVPMQRQAQSLHAGYMPFTWQKQSSGTAQRVGFVLLFCKGEGFAHWAFLEHSPRTHSKIVCNGKLKVCLVLVIQVILAMCVKHTVNLWANFFSSLSLEPILLLLGHLHSSTSHLLPVGCGSMRQEDPGTMWISLTNENGGCTLFSLATDEQLCSSAKGRP